MPDRKPPAVNPNEIVFDPKGNAKEPSRVAREDRRKNQGKSMAERERQAARARAEAETTTPRAEAAVEESELAEIEAEFARETEPPIRRRPDAPKTFTAPPLNVNATH